MSTYEWFEFVAVEKPLTGARTIELRGASSRATITPSGFVDEYHYGNIEGDARDRLGRLVDAYVHSASGGSCELTLALPGETWSEHALAPFLGGGCETGRSPAFEAERRAVSMEEYVRRMARTARAAASRTLGDVHAAMNASLDAEERELLAQPPVIERPSLRARDPFGTSDDEEPVREASRRAT